MGSRFHVSGPFKAKADWHITRHASNNACSKGGNHGPTEKGRAARTRSAPRPSCFGRLQLPLQRCSVSEHAYAKDLTFGYVPASLEYPYNVMTAKGFEEAAAAAGVKAVVLDPRGSVEKQGNSLDDLIAQKVDAIGFLPLDSVVAESFVDKINDAEIPVVAVALQVGDFAKPQAYRPLSRPVGTGGDEQLQHRLCFWGDGCRAVAEGPQSQDRHRYGRSRLHHREARIPKASAPPWIRPVRTTISLPSSRQTGRRTKVKRFVRIS